MSIEARTGDLVSYCRYLSYRSTANDLTPLFLDLVLSLERDLMSGKTPLFTALQRRSRVSFLFSSALFDIGVLYAAAESSRPRTGRREEEWGKRGGARKQRKDSRKFRRRFVLWYASPRSLNAEIFFKTSFFPRLIPSVIIADPCSEFQWN